MPSHQVSFSKYLGGQYLIISLFLPLCEISRHFPVAGTIGTEPSALASKGHQMARDQSDQHRLLGGGGIPGLTQRDLSLVPFPFSAHICLNRELCLLSHLGGTV